MVVAEVGLFSPEPLPAPARNVAARNDRFFDWTSFERPMFVSFTVRVAGSRASYRVYPLNVIVA